MTSALRVAGYDPYGAHCLERECLAFWWVYPCSAAVIAEMGLWSQGNNSRTCDEAPLDGSESICPFSIPLSIPFHCPSISFHSIPVHSRLTDPGGGHGLPRPRRRQMKVALTRTDGSGCGKHRGRLWVGYTVAGEWMEYTVNVAAAVNTCGAPALPLKFRHGIPYPD